LPSSTTPRINSFKNSLSIFYILKLVGTRVQRVGAFASVLLDKFSTGFASLCLKGKYFFEGDSLSAESGVGSWGAGFWES